MAFGIYINNDAERSFLTSEIPMMAPDPASYNATIYNTNDEGSDNGMRRGLLPASAAADFYAGILWERPPESSDTYSTYLTVPQYLDAGWSDSGPWPAGWYIDAPINPYFYAGNGTLMPYKKIGKPFTSNVTWGLRIWDAGGNIVYDSDNDYAIMHTVVTLNATTIVANPNSGGTVYNVTLNNPFGAPQKLFLTLGQMYVSIGGTTYIVFAIPTIVSATSVNVRVGLYAGGNTYTPPAVTLPVPVTLYFGNAI